MLRYFIADPTATSDATSLALVLQALLGVVPVDAKIALPLDEYHYKYNYDIDPDLFSLDVVDNTLKLAVSHEGTLEFNYGQIQVECGFPEKGISKIVFA